MCLSISAQDILAPVSSIARRTGALPNGRVTADTDTPAGTPRPRCEEGSHTAHRSDLCTQHYKCTGVEQSTSHGCIPQGREVCMFHLLHRTQGSTSSKSLLRSPSPPFTSSPWLSHTWCRWEGRSSSLDNMCKSSGIELSSGMIFLLAWFLKFFLNRNQLKKTPNILMTKQMLLSMILPTDSLSLTRSFLRPTHSSLLKCTF